LVIGGCWPRNEEILENRAKGSGVKIQDLGAILLPERLRKVIINLFARAPHPYVLLVVKVRGSIVGEGQLK
jgi:hypothetical protein